MSNVKKQDNRKGTDKDIIETISLLICGNGREIIVGEIPKDSIIPKEYLFDLYQLEMNADGKLITTHGFGEIGKFGPLGKKDLKMNQVENRDSTILVMFHLC